MSEQAATYSFIPWVKQGISNFVNEANGNTGPSTVTANVKVRTGASEQTVEVGFNLAGPGDVIGIQSQSVINTFPQKGDNNFGTYNLPFIEFYEEDFPWRFTPGRPLVDKVTPWVTLLVLEQGEFTVQQDAKAPLPLIQVTKAGVFPTPATLWAWAHVHANTAVNTASAEETNAFLNGALKGNPDLAFSRLLSPRRLKNGAAYTAFLIPTFEAGRSAGAGETYDESLPLHTVAWSRPGAENLRYPVYYQWDFRTDNAANFEYAVRQLRALDIASITQEQDASTMMHIDVTAYATSTPAGAQEPFTQDALPAVGLIGALKIIGEQDGDLLKISGFTKPLGELLNVSEERLQATAGSTSNFAGDPVVTPPVYGKWHAGVKIVDPLPDDTEGTPITANWLQHVNLDPRYRAIAGVGSRIVQKNQEEYVRKAWEQLGDIQGVNAYLRELQTGVKVGMRLRDKYLSPLRKSFGNFSNFGLESETLPEDNDNFMLMMAPALSRIQVPQATGTEAATTAEGVIRESVVPVAAFEGSFRKMVKVRELDATEPDGTSKEINLRNLISKLNTGAISAAGLKPVTDNTLTFYPISGILYASMKQNTVPSLYLPGNATKQSLNPESAQRLRQAVNDLPAGLVPVQETVKPPLLQSDLAAAAEVASDPLPYAKRKIKAAIGLVEESISGAFLESSSMATDSSEIKQLVVHPYFKQPMYETLRDYAEQLFLPDIAKVPQNTVALLEVNQKFVEAFMVGLNHEMSAELLWREFPTDQRGTYFRQFWDKKDNVNVSLSDEQKTDITPIHTWPVASSLGEHQQGTQAGTTVLLIRGDLLRKFPNAIIYAQEVVEVNGELKLDGDKRFPVSRADLVSDITILTFDLDAATLAGSAFGWYFVFGERPGQPSFSLELTSDITNPANILNWDMFSWEHLPESINLEPADLVLTHSSVEESAEKNIKTIETSAQLAYATFRRPAMVAIPAEHLM